MRLDKSVIDCVYNELSKFDYVSYGCKNTKKVIKKMLERLDLVTKFGDSSQSILVENK